MAFAAQCSQTNTAFSTVRSHRSLAGHVAVTALPRPLCSSTQRFQCVPCRLGRSVVTAATNSGAQDNEDGVPRDADMRRVGNEQVQDELVDLVNRQIQSRGKGRRRAMTYDDASPSFKKYVDNETMRDILRQRLAQDKAEAAALHRESTEAIARAKEEALADLHRTVKEQLDELAVDRAEHAKLKAQYFKSTRDTVREMYSRQGGFDGSHIYNFPTGPNSTPEGMLAAKEEEEKAAARAAQPPSRTKLPFSIALSALMSYGIYDDIVQPSTNWWRVGLYILFAVMGVAAIYQSDDL